MSLGELQISFPLFVAPKFLPPPPPPPPLKMLTTGVVDHDVVAKYPEIDECTFPIQLQMFKQTNKAESLQDAKVAYRGADPTVLTVSPKCLFF